MLDKYNKLCYNIGTVKRERENTMTCKECNYKEDCCFYRKEEEDWTCVYETFKRNKDAEDNAKKGGK